MTQTTYDAEHAVEVADGVYHLGVQDEVNVWANIPYLVVSGGEGLIIDPGSAIPEFFEVVKRKVEGIIDLKKVKHIVVQHQDPDLCAAMKLFEPLCADDLKFYAPLEARLLVQHYGLNRPIHNIDDGDTLTFGDGRTLVFAMTPYCHFVGSMVTYDVATKTVFSSDAFGGFSADNSLWAGADYPIQMSVFLGEYLGSKRALEYALKRLELLDKTHGIDLICPQHGCMIKKSQIPMYLEAAHALEVGGQIDYLAQKYGIKLEGNPS